jgi:hypothetical protein
MHSLQGHASPDGATVSTSEIHSIHQLFDRAAHMAAERLRELYGQAMFDDLVADTGASVRVTFALQSRSVMVFVAWPGRFGDRPQMPIAFVVPQRDAPHG